MIKNPYWKILQYHANFFRIKSKSLLWFISPFNRTVWHTRRPSMCEKMSQVQLWVNCLTVYNQNLARTYHHFSILVSFMFYRKANITFILDYTLRVERFTGAKAFRIVWFPLCHFWGYFFYLTSFLSPLPHLDNLSPVFLKYLPILEHIVRSHAPSLCAFFHLSEMAVLPFSGRNIY